jgi:hypothetical protein
MRGGLDAVRDGIKAKVISRPYAGYSFLAYQTKSVARMERSGMRVPDFAALHPGY